MIVAVLVCGSGPSTRALRTSVRAKAVVTVGMDQTPVAGSYVPWLGMNETRVKPAGKRSATCTLVAMPGPRSVNVTVKATVSPTLGLALLTVLVSCRSACSVVIVALS